MTQPQLALSPTGSSCRRSVDGGVGIGVTARAQQLATSSSQRSIQAARIARTGDVSGGWHAQKIDIVRKL